jgi:hypothetical protein
MFDSQQKSTGTRYTMTIALLVGALIFSPAILIVSGRSGYAAISLTLACSALCVTLAWINWKRHSELTIPSIATPSARAK